MNQPKKKMDLQAGVKYRGYGILNEYGEFEFIPEQTGINKGKKKIIKTGDGFTVSATKNMVIVHITVQKPQSRIRLLDNFLQRVNETLLILRDYEI